MAAFGKLNFSTSFNPTSAFPLDARCYFTSLAEAQAAAATAEPIGSTNTVYYYGQKLLVYENDAVTWYTIQPSRTLLADGSNNSNSAEQFSLVIDGVEYSIGNVTDSGPTGSDDEYSLEFSII